MTTLKTELYRIRKTALPAAILIVLACGCSPEKSPDFPGDYAVARARISEFSLEKAALYGDLHFPSADGSNFDPAALPCPLILFLPGYLEPPLFYRSYGEQLASWGYATLTVHLVGLSDDEHLRNVSEILAWCKKENEAGGAYAGCFDFERLGIAGHSFGGKYALMASLEIPEIRAIVALDPIDGAAEILPGILFFRSFTPERMPEVTAPSCIIGAELPGPINPVSENYHQFYLHAQCTAEEVTIIHADHASFLDDFAGLVQPVYDTLFGGESTQDKLTKSTSARYMTAWFNVFLRGEKDYLTYLTGEAAQKDSDEGIVRIESNF